MYLVRAFEKKKNKNFKELTNMYLATVPIVRISLRINFI